MINQYILDRKKQTKLICDIIHNIFLKLSKKPIIRFYLMLLIHVLLGFIMLICICLCDINSVWFLIGNAMLFIQIISNIYFRGCILIKIERREIGNDWYGYPYNFIFGLLGIEKSAYRVNILYSILTIILIIISLIRIYKK